jgi:flagellar basal body-associated protein FliL
METLLVFLIVLLSVAICALAGYWFYRTAQERKHGVSTPQVANRTGRNIAWDRAVRSARNRNW